MADPIQVLRDAITEGRTIPLGQRVRDPDDALAQVEALVEAARRVDYYGTALIARNFRPESPAVAELVDEVRAALAPFKDTT